MSVRRWVLALVVLGVIVAMIAYARGDEHHRGDEIGATADPALVDVTGGHAGELSE
ncbi:MAG: hypothetical protein ACRDO2_05825 [Nocardioidaceae bacterium]